MITLWTQHIAPGVNNLYANIPGKGRVKSKRYREWERAAGWDMNGKGHISGPFTLDLTVCESKRRKGTDLDGKIKATLDLIVKHGIVDDDSLVQAMTVRWGEALGGMRIMLEPFTGGSA